MSKLLNFPERDFVDNPSDYATKTFKQFHIMT